MSIIQVKTWINKALTLLGISGILKNTKKIYHYFCEFSNKEINLPLKIDVSLPAGKVQEIVLKIYNIGLFFNR